MLDRIPYPISHFLGYRKSTWKPKLLPAYRVYFWSFIAAWISIAVLACICTYGASFKQHNTPMIIASFGASAVLLYGALDSPLAQPRNVICGHIISSLVGVIISQLFLGIKKEWDPNQFIAVQWVGGATAMALALFVMQITKTVHPPGGATALIAVVTSNILEMKWFYIGVVTLCAVIQVTIACLVNNIERRYPQYWWEPSQLPLKIDPTVLSTVMSTHSATTTPHHHHQDIECADSSSTVTQQEEEQSIDDQGLFVTLSKSSQHETINIERAISILKKHCDKSNIQYALILPDSEVISTPNFVNTNTIESIIKQQ